MGFLRPSDSQGRPLGHRRTAGSQTRLELGGCGAWLAVGAGGTRLELGGCGASLELGVGGAWLAVGAGGTRFELGVGRTRLELSMLDTTWGVGILGSGDEARSTIETDGAGPQSPC